MKSIIVMALLSFLMPLSSAMAANDNPPAPTDNPPPLPPSDMPPPLPPTDLPAAPRISIETQAIAGATFSLHNKSKHSICITLLDGNGRAIKGGAGMINAGKFYDTAALNAEDSATLKVEAQCNLDQRSPFVKIFSLAAKKNKYINWTDENEIYPQRGPLRGLTGKTDHGYSTKNNISKSGIKEAK